LENQTETQTLINQIMKKITTLLFSLVAVLLSCSKDDAPQADSSDVLLQKIVTHESNGETYETAFKYEGSKLLEARSKRENKKFDYSGDLISKISWFSNPDADNTLSQTVVFNYLPDGRLKSFEQNSTSSFRVEFTYIDGERVDFHAFASRNSYNFNGYFKVKNSEISQYVYSAGATPRPSVDYHYDDKSHPLKNVTGYNKLFLYHYFYNSFHLSGFTTNIGSSKNCTSNSLIEDPDRIEITETYDYNDNGFPKTITRSNGSAKDDLFY